MLTAIVLFVLCTATASWNSGPTFVTLEQSRNQGPDVSVSPYLCSLVADRRLLLTADRFYRPRSHRSPSAALVSLLLLLGGVESNPGPTATARNVRSAQRDCLSLGLLNVRSACNKAALIHDVIDENHHDALAMTETWITSDAPNAVKLDVAPTGFSVIHRHRGSSADRRGAGVALIHRDSIRATTIDVGDYTEFELLAVKLVGRRSKSVIVVCVYRPPGAVTSTFTGQLSDLFDQLMLLDTQFVVVGDFNSPGELLDS